MRCKADGEAKYRSNLMVVRILARRPTKQIASPCAFYLRIAAIPGSSLPSRYSSIAPPPVDT